MGIQECEKKPQKEIDIFSWEFRDLLLWDKGFERDQLFFIRSPSHFRGIYYFTGEELTILKDRYLLNEVKGKIGENIPENHLQTFQGFMFHAFKQLSEEINNTEKVDKFGSIRRDSFDNFIERETHYALERAGWEFKGRSFLRRIRKKDGLLHFLKEKLRDKEYYPKIDNIKDDYEFLIEPIYDAMKSEVLRAFVDSSLETLVYNQKQVKKGSPKRRPLMCSLKRFIY